MNALEGRGDAPLIYRMHSSRNHRDGRMPDAMPGLAATKD